MAHSCGATSLLQQPMGMKSLKYCQLEWLRFKINTLIVDMMDTQIFSDNGSDKTKQNTTSKKDLIKPDY